MIHVATSGEGGDMILQSSLGVHILRPPSCGSSSSAPDGNKMPIWHSTVGDPLAVCPRDVPSGHSSHQWWRGTAGVSMGAWHGAGQGRGPPTSNTNGFVLGCEIQASSSSQAHPCCLYSPQHHHQPRTRSALYTRCYERAAGRQIDDKTAWPSPICYDQQAVYKFIERAVTRSKVSGGGMGGGNEMNRLSIHYGIRHVNLAPSYPLATIHPLSSL